MDTKRCPRCKETLPTSAFGVHRGNPDGLQVICNPCKRASQLASYHRNKDRERERLNASRRERRLEIRKTVDEYLREHPCVDCGERDIIVLEFDHVSGEKEATVSALMSGTTALSRILREIKKCEVRCANCHRRVTYFRRFGTFER